MPENWIQYDRIATIEALTEAKAAVLSLRTIPYQRPWVEGLQYLQLKREVAGTSRIEGADFTEGELEAAFKEGHDQLVTRSQRQARAAVETYRWIARLPDDRPINTDLICQVHRWIITGADDDHCPPGAIRKPGDNVSFGSPLHRGAEGGKECELAFARLGEAIQGEFRDHDLLIQALALHYHFAAIHPFFDGNGRTARAVEALMLQRAGLRDALFIAMSNYYYEEKASYLSALGEVRARNHDLTPFLLVGLKGIAAQCGRLSTEIGTHVSKALFINMMRDFSDRLSTKRKRLIAARQIKVLNLLLGTEWINLDQLIHMTEGTYKSLKNPVKALVRDLIHLRNLGAIRTEKPANNGVRIGVRLEWPTEITEGDFFEKVKQFPKAKSYLSLL